MGTRIDIHLQSGNVSVYWLWLLLDVSAVRVVIVIIAICDMPRQEFSLRGRVYIHNTYMKSRKSCLETRRKFRVKFPGGPVPNPSTISWQAKRFKETGSVKDRKVNRRRHVLTEETLDEIGERLEHNPQKYLKGYHWKLEYLCRLYKEQQNYWNYIYVLWIYTRSHNENSCLGMSQIAIITINTLTALTCNNNHNQ